MLLRRLAYNVTTLFRSITQRSEQRRTTPWKTVLRWFYNAFIAATETDVANLRNRQPALGP